MTNTLKLEKLVGILEETALKNEMVNDFGYGETDDIMNLKQPFVWIEPTGSVIQGPFLNELIYLIDVFVMDRLNKGEDNWLETTSDTLYILHTYIGQIAKSDEFINLGLRIDGDIITEPSYEVQDENCNGHKATLRIKIANRINPCNSPVN